MKHAIAIAAASLALAGCSTHYHSMLVTSSPTGQRFSILAADKHHNVIKPENEHETMRTPYELTLDGNVWTADVTVNFDDGSQQTKTACFAHPAATREAWEEPFLGIPLLLKETESGDRDRKVHFDAVAKAEPGREPLPGCRIPPPVRKEPERGERITQESEYRK